MLNNERKIKPRFDHEKQQRDDTMANMKEVDGRMKTSKLRSKRRRLQNSDR